MIKSILQKLDAKFFYRLSYYSVGLMIGIVALVFINKQKGNSFDYGPNARTLKQIRLRKTFIYTEKAKNTFKAHELDSLDMAYILHKGDVDFSKSNPRVKPCPDYWIDATINKNLHGDVINKEVSVVIERCDSVATVKEVVIH